MTGIYLMFNGNCMEALSLYEKAFGIKLARVEKYGDMPPNPAFPVSEAQKNLVLHAMFELGGTEIMCADSNSGISEGNNTYISVTEKDAELVTKAWKILSEGAEVYMELQPSFFALHHGSLRDRFGVCWMFTVPKA
jgi:PhnB protein